MLKRSYSKNSGTLKLSIASRCVQMLLNTWKACLDLTTVFRVWWQWWCSRPYFERHYLQRKRVDLCGILPFTAGNSVHKALRCLIAKSREILSCKCRFRVFDRAVEASVKFKNDTIVLAPHRLVNRRLMNRRHIYTRHYTWKSPSYFASSGQNYVKWCFIGI